MTIEELMEEWSGDCSIDVTEPSRELAKIPILHAKYMRTHSHHNLIVKKLTFDYQNLKKRKIEYYRGEFSHEDYEETGWEYFVKKTGRDINIYIDSDNDLNMLLMKKVIHEEIVNFCQSIIKELNNRTFQLNSIVKWEIYSGGK
jgi:hypothetical protein